MLESYRQLIDWGRLEPILSSQHQQLVNIDHWDSYKQLLAAIQFPEPHEYSCDFGPLVRATLERDCSDRDQTALERAVAALIPWRKGPFSLFGLEIEAEWRSDQKWERIAPHLPDLKGRRVLDIGCNNGYYLYRMVPQEPECVLGLDPNGLFYHQFHLLQRVFQIESIEFAPLGIEHVGFFQGFFDVALCMGVIYHRKDPYTALTGVRDALAEGGWLVLEGMVLEGNEAVCLCPPSRYAKMRNVWYLPTVKCMEAWLLRSGFDEIRVVSEGLVLPIEQRQTKYAPYESLTDFLDPKDPSLTVEGYSAPRRACLIARKKG